jgi:hypothetical protein
MNIFHTIALLLISATTATVGAQEQQFAPEPNVHLKKYLDERGISVERWRFCEAIRRQSSSAVTHYLDGGIDPNITCDVSGSDLPAIFLAVSDKKARAEIVSALVKRGANVNARYTPKSMKSNAEGASFTAQMQRLNISMMQSVQNVDYFPLYYAAQWSNPEIVELLIQLGADISYRTGTNGMGALSATSEIEIAKVLIKHGANINERDSHGRTILRKLRQDVLAHLGERDYRRPKYEEYAEWLASNGARE